MEALIGILVEALGLLLAPLLQGIAALIGGVISCIMSWTVDLIGLALSQKTSSDKNSADTAPAQTGPPGPATPQGPRRRPRWVRWVAIVCLVFTGVALSTLVVINTWFIDDLARWLLAKQQEKNGIAITADTIDGNLFSGRFTATGITVQRRDHPAGFIDLTVKRLDATVSVWRVLANPLVVESVVVTGVAGRYERGVPGQEPVKKPLTIAGVTVEQNDGKTSLVLDTQRPPKRRFAITALTITGVEVDYVDHTRKRPLNLPVTITTLTANPLRSQWAVFDVLFRANASGSVAGRPFTITTNGDDLGRDTQWHVDGLPVAVLADQIGGPFALLSGGTADVHVVDHWRKSDDQRVIVMDWSVVLNQVKAEVPETTTAMMALLAKPAVAFINANGERVPLSFRVEIDENRFDGAASAEAAGLWHVVADSAAATLAKVLGVDTDAVKDTGTMIREGAKGILDHWRKKKD
jgi:hypothetical protein